MINSRELLEPEYLVIECDSTWTGACSYILTSCADQQKVDEVCETASETLEEEEGQSIEFNTQTLKQFIEDSCIIDEIRDGDRDGFDDVDPDQLTIERVFLPENLPLLYEIVDQLFNTGYVNGIIAGYVECDDVPILKASE